MLAEAIDSRVCAQLTEICANGFVERSLALGLPHHSIQVVVTKPISDQCDQEIAGIRIIEARAAADAPSEIHLRYLFKTRHQLRIVGLLEQAVRLHTSRFRFRNHVSKDVKLSEFGSADILNDRLRRKLRVHF